jgi:hypothetical protein
MTELYSNTAVSMFSVAVLKMEAADHSETFITVIPDRMG